LKAPFGLAVNTVRERGTAGHIAEEADMTAAKEKFTGD
jgi:hypothetical protein